MIRIFVHISLVLGVLLTPGCTDDADLESCLEYCGTIKNGQVNEQEGACDNFCNAWSELVALAGCQDQWAAAWQCYRDSPLESDCPTSPDWQGCAEDYCKDHQDACDEISMKYEMYK